MTTLSTLSLNSVEVKHERRVVLVFSDALDVGAFGVPAPALYVITCLDSSGVNPGLAAAMIAVSNPSVVELALSDDLVAGGLYNISAVGVPSAAGAVTPNPTDLQFRFGMNTTKRDVEPILNNRDALLYGVDLLWNGEDYQETASGDLDRIGGPANVTKALYRGLEANGLTWDQTYGAHTRDFVDSPSPTSGTLKGSVQAQILRDPRVSSAKIAISTEDEKTYLIITPKLITGDVLKQVSMVVPEN